MPLYLYEYTTKDNEKKIVEHLCSFNEKPLSLEVEDGDVVYIARPVLGVNANMKRAWGYTRNTADLPPIDYRPPGS